MGFAFPKFTYSDIQSKTPGFGFGAAQETFTDPGALAASSPAGAGTGFEGLLTEIIKKQYDPKIQSELRKGHLEDLLTFQKEQMKQAAPYKMMFELPGQVMQAFAVPAQIRSNIMLAGQGAANQLLAQGLQSSAYNMPSMGYERPSTRYFS